jgi:hypothetical protein
MNTEGRDQLAHLVLASAERAVKELVTGGFVGHQSA